jgi:enamine deaminase RidA (YjgF/YER057c/UK114 family)
LIGNGSRETRSWSVSWFCEKDELFGISMGFRVLTGTSEEKQIWKKVKSPMKKSRRGLMKVLFLGAAGGSTSVSVAAHDKPSKKVHYRNKKPDKTPLFSGAVSYGNLLFIAGKGAHFEGDIKAHTDHVLKQIEEELVNAGSSMEKVLKAQVYLNDLADYKAMNEVFHGRFGPEPPVRTTVAPAGGIPGNSLVEIDVIAYI